MSKRLYKSGTRWCFWRWTLTDSAYIVRLHLIKTPWFALVLHWINKPDPEPYLHDHPVSFLSIFLRGGYSEMRKRKSDVEPKLRHHRWFNWIRATPNDRHSITFVKGGTLTLCFMGPKTREWGYHTDGGGWVYWKTYVDAQRTAKKLTEGPE